MDENKFKLFTGCFEKALKEISLAMGGLTVQNAPNGEFPGDKKTIIVIGVTGKNKGRVLLELNDPISSAITEYMNGEPLQDPMEKYFFLAEFANIFCGKAITLLNNIYKGSDLRLTPPAIIAGTSMEIASPNIQSSQLFFLSGNGTLSLNMGFEGV